MTRKESLIGLAGGFLSGLLGIGGGTVMVPLLVFWNGFSQRNAHAVSLAAIIPISIAALLVYGVAGAVDVVAAITLTVGAIAGALLGARLLVGAPERYLKTAFGCVMWIAAIGLVATG